MLIVNLREICPVFAKGFTKELIFGTPRVTILFSTCHESMVKKGKETKTDSVVTFELPRYKTVENDNNVLTMVVENYNANLDTNVSFVNSNVIIELTPNGKNHVDREDGRPCFSHSISESFIDITKYDTIIMS